MITRISGLASGMDIDQIVSDLMKVERTPLDKLLQSKQTLEWERDNYRETNTLLKDFDNFLFEGVGRNSTFSSKSIDNSNSNIVSALSLNGGSSTSVTIKDISQLATASKWTSASVQVNSASADTTLNFKVTKPGETTPITVDDILIKAGDTVEQIVSKINDSPKLGVNAFYDSYTKSIVIKMENNGSGGQIVVGDASTATLMNQLGFNGSASGSGLTGETAGQDAIFSIDGLVTSRSSNTFNVNGVQYTLLKENTGESSTISTKTNVDAIYDSIVKFVDKYNDVIGKLQQKTTETRYRDYKPLNDEQKESMSDRQVELWEEKAKSGLLKGDSIISNGINQMRETIYNFVDTGNPNMGRLIDIGISTSNNYREGGKLTIDPQKLKKAISNNPTTVSKLFSQDNGYQTEQVGIAKQLRAVIDGNNLSSGQPGTLPIKGIIDRIEKKSGNIYLSNTSYSIGKDINNISKRISDFQDRLSQTESRYYRQFSAMEKAIQRSNEQAALLMGQLGGQN